MTIEEKKIRVYDLSRLLTQLQLEIQTLNESIAKDESKNAVESDTPKSK